MKKIKVRDLAYVPKTIRNCDWKVTPIPKPIIDAKNVIGGEIFPDPFTNIGMFAPTKSGKTSLSKEIMVRTTDPEITKVIIVAKTLHNDKSYDNIVKWLESKGYDYETHTSLIDDDGVNVLTALSDQLSVIAQMEKEEKEKEEKKEELTYEQILLGYIPIRPKMKKRQKSKKEKKIAPKYFIVLDDMTSELRLGKELANFLKTSRHYNARVVIGTQHYMDLDPHARATFYYAMLFGGLDIKKVIEIHKDMELSWVNLDEFLKIYNWVTKEKYSFLFIDREKGELRKCFGEQILYKS